MEVSALIPMVAQLLGLGLKIADLIDKADNVSDDDKAAMKAAIKEAQEKVDFWT